MMVGLRTSERTSGGAVRGDIRVEACRPPTLAPPHSNIASFVALLHCRFPSSTPFATQRSNDCDAAREAARNAMSTGGCNLGAGVRAGAGVRTLNGPFLRSSHPRRQTRTE